MTILCSEVLTGVTIGAIGGAIASIVFWIFEWLNKKFQENNDKQKIHKWLQENAKDVDEKRFRSTKVIASYSNLTHDRVTYICSVHPDICESTGNLDGKWGLWGISRLRED